MYNLSFAEGKVSEILREYPSITFIKVEIPGEEPCKAVNYNYLSGSVNVGDQVILNTTAVRLSLGTGGYHFVNLNLTALNQGLQIPGDDRENITGDTVPLSPGHIMKLRYTPLQLRTLSAEEEDSPYHEEIRDFKSLEGNPVVLLPLHSLLAPLAISYKVLNPEKKLVYIMSDGACLALDFSNLVRELVCEEYLDSTITYGNAFGGDYETVNIFTALATASKIACADLIVVGIGPGIVGTNTKYGFSGVENAFIEKAIRTLKGRTILIPRVSFAEKRRRHYGISHHTITLLEELINEPVELAFPDHDYLRDNLASYGLEEKHKIDFYPIQEIKEILESSSFPFTSMGRKYDDDPLFFITAGLAVYKV